MKPKKSINMQDTVFYENLLQEFDKLTALLRLEHHRKACFPKFEESTLWKYYNFSFSLILQ